MKKRRYLVSVLILILILSIITITILNFSEARKTITVSLEVKDTESKIDNQTTSIEAVNENDAGYYIILPDEINGRYITKYYVEETTIITTEVTTSTESSTGASSSTDTSESTAIEKTQSTDSASAEDGETTVTEDNEATDESTSENTATEAETSSQETTSEASSGTTQETTSGTSSETTQEATKTETQTQTSYSSKTVEKLPGEKVYLTEDEQTNKKVVLNIKYDYTTVDNETMYKKNIQVENEANEITVTGYLPEDAELQVEEIESEEIFDSVQENYENVIEINVAYDIKIISNEQEFEPEDIGQDVEVNISGLSLEGDNRVVHITEENEIQEVESEVDEESENITFKAESFSYYAVLTVTNAEVEVTTESVWNGEIASSFTIGAGTANDPYLITTAAELAYLAQQVNGGTAYSGIYFKMAANIDLNYNTWTPIGTATTSFSGVFDGNGYIISNATIEISSTDISVQAYGIFGSISGSSTSSAIIKNVDFENITISITTNTTVTSDGFAYKIGIVTGAMYSYSEIQNVIVQGSQITHTGTISAPTDTFDGYVYPIVYVGGIAGEACYSANSSTTQVTSGNYIIDNCYSDVDITVNTNYGGSRRQMNKFNIGGIIGRISWQNTWPTDCLYTGTITSTNSAIGPIFGAETTSGTTSYSSNNLTNFSNNIWAGNTSSEMTSYYTAYTVNGTSFTSSVAEGGTVQRRSNTNSNIGYVQGVNKGLYTTDISGTILTMFNNNASTDKNSTYSTWVYENGKFSFKHGLTVEVIETIENSKKKTYKIVPTSSLAEPTYSFTWYKEGKQLSESDGITTSETDEDTYSEYTVTPSLYNDIVVQVLVSDGEETVVVNFTVAKLTIYIEITYNEETNNLTAELKGTALEYLEISNYTYQWYSEDISGMENEELEGETSLTLEDISSDLDYKIVATYTEDGEVSELFTVSASYEPADRIVIFVDYSNGNNNNDGYTPETAVKTLPTAYGKLNSDTEKNTTGKNVIVIMGNYTVMDVFTTQSNSTYEKNVTITGCYKGTKYNARLYMYYSGSNYNFINGDTVFEYLTFDGNIQTDNRGNTSNGNAYIFSQGHNITMGEQIYMENYDAASTQQGLILGSGQSAPSFTLFGGYWRYNEEDLPRNNSVITIKSGAYGRIVLGGSPGSVPTNLATNDIFSKSGNFTGNKDEYYNCTINVDINNSTSGSYTYDINLLVGGSAWGSMYANITENINSGTIGRVLGGSIGDAQTSQINKYPFDTFIGSTTINITGGTIYEVYGGCLGRNMGGTNNTNDCEAYFYGTIEINISGGTIKNCLYGAGAGRSYRL